MASVSDHMSSSANYTSGETLASARMASCPMIQAVSSFVGFVLMASAVGIWVVSGIGLDIEMVLFKLVFTLVLFGTGLAMTLSSRKRIHPEVHLDNERGELRIVERGCDGIARLKTAISYDTIQEVDFRDGMLSALGQDGKVLLEMPMGMIENLAELRAAINQTFGGAA